VLIVGVAASATLIGAGFLLALAIGLAGLSPERFARDWIANHRLLRTCEPTGPRWSPWPSPSSASWFLLATPVARVAASVVGFRLEGDRLYAAGPSGRARGPA